MQLGRESISSSITAIIELVKNAYDADADRVVIRLGTLRSRRFMVIEDNGDGMTAQTLKENWMVIGTANKTSHRKTTGKRRTKTGEKGLGRLGLDRLCSHTRVQSASPDASEGVELKINWKKYEAPDSRLEAVEHRLYSIPGLGKNPVTGEEPDSQKGTRLILMGLKDRWDEAQLKELHRELSLLLSPFGKPEDFQIDLNTGGTFTALDGIIEPPEELLEQAYWKVEGTIDDAGMVQISMTASQRAQEYHQQMVPWREFIKGYGDTPQCGPLSFQLFFYRRNRDEEEPTILRPALEQFLDNNQGVRIYRDGFRVKPYGEPNGEGDWLRLAYRRMQNPKGIKQGSWRVGYNQIVGAVFLGRERNPELIDQTNREGLVLGDAYNHLVAFADRVVRFFERYHTEFERKKDKERGGESSASADTKATSDAAAVALGELSQLAARLEQLTGGGQPTAPLPPTTEAPPAAITKIKDVLSSAVAKFETALRQKDAVIEQRDREKNTMANLASLGILAACFGHETLGWANVVATNANLLRRGLQKKMFMVLPDAEKEVLRSLGVLHTESAKLETFAAFALGNVRPAKRRRGEVCIKEVASEVFSVFQKTFQEDKHVKVDLNGVPPDRCPISAYRIDWESIFLNLVVNAVWGMRQTPIDQRQIRLRITKEGDVFRIVFEDSGHGLEAGTEDQIFDAGFSSKRNARSEQEGTGMGLFIVKSFVENSGGKIQAFAKGDLGGAKFSIEVSSLNASAKPKETENEPA